ncbi:hypothetical protein GPALN_010573 [Globodera pallida]|nr:hypothetical protein GPALN_010573 [Globodera pallida]
MIGPNNELQAFLTAYKCSSEDQSQTPPIMYSFGILPNYSNDNIGKLGHSTSDISSIRLNKDISAESKLIAHFYREYEAISSSYQVDFKHSHYCNLTNFMLQLMNRVQESPNLSEYFVNAKFSTELEQKNYVSNDIKEHQDFIHFAEAVHVNWNPYKELLITLQNFNYVALRVRNGLGNFTAAIRDSFLYKLVKMLQDKKLQTLENFVEIEQICNKLKEMDELFDAGKGTKSDEKSAFDLIVILNAELEKAKTFCMGKI